MCLKDDGKQRRGDCGGINNFHLRQASDEGGGEDKKHEGITIRNVEMNILWSFIQMFSFFFPSIVCEVFAARKHLPVKWRQCSSDDSLLTDLPRLQASDF